MSMRAHVWTVWLLCFCLSGCGGATPEAASDKPGKDAGDHNGSTPEPEPEPEPEPVTDAGTVEPPVEMDPFADLPKEEVKSDLELMQDSFSFPNFAGKDPRASVTPKLAARMFGSANICAALEGDVCRATPLARTWTQNINASMEGGRCEGFAVLSALFAMGELNPADFGGTSASDIVIEGNEPLNREIAYWFSSQYLPSVRKNSRTLNAVDALKELAVEFKKPATERDMFRIGMVRLDEMGKPRGGHAVMPYAVGPGDAVGQYKIKIYDNNHPKEDRFILVDAAQNRWEYQASSNPSEAASLYAGDLTNKNGLYFASVRIRQGQQECPFCTGDEAEADQYFSQVFTLGSASTVAEDPSGAQTGVMDGKFVNTIPGASVLPSYSVDPWRDDTQPVIHLPASKRTKLRLTGKEGGGSSDITIVGPGYTAGVEGAKIGQGNFDELTVEEGGKGVGYVPSPGSTPTLFAGLQNKAGTQTLVRIELPEGIDLSAVNIDINPDTGDVGLSAKSDEGVSLQIEVTRSTGQAEDLFEGTIVAPEGGAVEIAVKEWAGEGTPIEVAVDEDGDGVAEQVVVVEDTGPVNEPPAAPSRLGSTSIALDAVSLVWADNSTSEGGFLLQRDDGNGFATIAQLAANTASFVDYNVFRATTYEYRVRSFNEYGDSAWTVALQVVTPDCPENTQDHDGNNVCTATCAQSGLACGAYGTCSDATGTVACVCDATHAGTLCTECAAGLQDNDDNGTCTATCATSGLDCGANGACSDASGTAQCVCDAGYAGLTFCDDVDECLTNNGGCDSLTTCTNTAGGNSCGACPSGYTGSGDTSCVDVDECQVNNGGCDTLTACTNTAGGNSCGACPSGYTGSGDTSCVNIDECLSAPCGAGTCVDTAGSYTCMCDPGYDDCSGDQACETDLLNDGQNCGACGNICAAGEVCDGATCVAPTSPCPVPGNAQLVFALDLPTDAAWASDAHVPYTEDNRSILSGFSFARVGFCMVLDGEYVYAEMDDFTGSNVGRVAMPTEWVHKTTANHLTVFSNSPNVTDATGATGGVELWPSNYGTGLNGTYDYDDDGYSLTPGYGSFQIHNGTETVMAWNNWGGGQPGGEGGFGNQVGGQHPDWTFASNGSSYATRRLYGYVVPEVVLGANLLNGTFTGGAASVVEVGAYNGASLYNPDLLADCTAPWAPQGALCDEPNTTHSMTESTKSNVSSGTTWLAGGPSGVGVAVIDAATSITFDDARVFQMFSDGKTTHLRLSIHAQTSSAPAWNDAGWVAVTGFEPIGVGASDGTSPTIISVPTSTTRYVKVEAMNDGSQGFGNYIELRALKLFYSGAGAGTGLSGLVHCWGGEGTSNDEVSGNTATLGSGMQYAPGRSGQAFYCDGSFGNETSVTASAPPAVAPTGELTYEFWINPEWTNGDVWVFDRTYAAFSGTGAPLIDLKLNGNIASWYVRYDAGNDGASAQFNIPSSTWSHVTLTRGGGQWTAYLNGAIVVPPFFDSGASLTPDPPRWCGHSDSPDQFMVGAFDSVRIWNRALSSMEVANVAAGDGSCSAAPM